ncbi:unnamed protein product [Ascophyllum nodosum]
MSESSGVPNSLSSGSAVAAAEGPFAPSRQAPRNNSASTRGGQNRGSRGGRSINGRANAGRGNYSDGHASRRRGNSKRGRGRGGGRRGGIGGSHGKTAGQAAAPPDQEESEDGERPLCIVCAEELVYFAVGECNHSGRCSKCAMRSRMLLKDQSCPECKTRLDRLVVTKLPASGEPPRFESFNLWGDFAGPDAEFDEGSGMIFQSCASHLEHLVHARELRCPVGGCKRKATSDDDVRKIEREAGGRPFLTKEALVDHMKSAHQRFFCGVCLESRPLFVSEQEVFHGIAALRKHESRPDGGHPLCRFCSRRFFDNVALYEHMTSSHINCHLCPEEHQHRYFRGEPQLRDHLRTSHFLCDRDYCRRRGVVSAFTTPQELQAHLAEEHGLTDHHRGTAAVGFTIRRAARDGSGLVGAAAGSQHDASHGSSATLDHHGAESFAAPDPVADLSEGVVVIAPGGRRDAGIPSLGGGSGRSSGGGGGGAGGWAGVTGRSPPSVQEAFPSLPSASSRPRPLQERHEFSLVGRRSRPDRAGSSSVAGAVVSSGSSERAGADKDRASKGENEVLLRNKRLAEALGIRLGAGAAVGGAKVGTTAGGTTVAMGLGDGLDAIREHLERTNYSTFLVSWARANRSELLKLERRLADLVADRRGTSTQLKPMPADHRRAVHELAVHYGLVTQSYDLEPKRYVSAIKQKGCRIPTRLLSVATRDPSYKGTDDVAPDAPLATVGIEPAALRSAGGVLSSSSAAAPPLPPSSLAPETSPLSPTPPSAGTPGTARVTSISSTANPPSNLSREAGGASSKAPHQPKKDGQGQRRTAAASSRPLLPQPRPQQQAQRDAAERRLPPGFEDMGNAGSSVPLSSAATASTSQEEHHHPQHLHHQQHSRSGGVGGGPPPENLLVFHSLKAGLWGEGVLEAVRELVPARTVLGFRAATASEASATGVTGRVGVVEFSSGVNARRAREKIEKDADQLIAAARVTRADYHPPFRTLPYPSTTSASILTPVKADDALAIEGLSVRDNWDSSDDELDVLGSVEGPGEGNAANANDAAVSGEVVDAARQDHEGGFSEVEEVSWRVEEASSAGMAAGSGEERRGGAMMPQRDARALEASISTTTTADVFVEAGEGDKEENTNGEAATAVPEGKVEKLKGTNGATKGSAHPTAAGGGVGSAPERRSSKWGNSVIRGRLSRPSDGRVPTVEQEARERKERIEELRRLDEERRESRKQQRDVEKREGRRGTGNPDAHAFVWENLAESSSEEESSSSEQQECAEASKDSQQRGPREEQGQNYFQQKGEGGFSSPSPAECSRLETLETQRAKASGWACEKCTLWNDFDAEEHRGNQGSGDGERPRCAVCEAEAPRNVGLPWSTA